MKLREYETVSSFRRDFYVYEAAVNAIATGASANDSIQIEADSDFILQKLVQWTDNAGVQQTAATRVIPNVTVQITDTGSGRQILNQPTPIGAIFGDGNLPFILPNPRLFMRNSTIQVAFTSFEVAATPDIFLGFVGYKIYNTR